MANRELLEVPLQTLAHHQGMLHQALPLDHIEYRLAHGSRDRRTGEGVEITKLRAKRVEYLRARHHRTHGIPVAHGFTHGDHIGPNAMALETPHRCPGAAESALHLA